jgi:hypothetical protein
LEAWCSLPTERRGRARSSHHGDEIRGLRPPILSRELPGSIPDARRDSQGRNRGRDGGGHETGPVAALPSLSALGNGGRHGCKRDGSVLYGYEVPSPGNRGIRGEADGNADYARMADSVEMRAEESLHQFGVLRADHTGKKALLDRAHWSGAGSGAQAVSEGGNERCARESSWAATQPMRVRGLGLARKLGQIAPERPRNVIVPFSFFPAFFSSLSNSI